MKKMFQLTPVLLIVFFFSACSQTKVWTYTPNSQKYLNDPLIKKSCVVPDFVDKRINKNSNCVGVAYIPLAPFGWQSLNTPEGGQVHMTSTIWMWRPPEDLAKATASEVENAQIFSECFYSPRKKDAQYALIGELESTRYHGKIFTYFLSAYGPILWFVGFPACYTENELIINFRLINTSTQNTIWEKRYAADDSSISWLYYIQADFVYDVLMKQILNQLVSDLQRSGLK